LTSAADGHIIVLRVAKRALGYGLAVVTVGLALLARLELVSVLGPRHRFPTFFIAVALSAWLGGLGPALLALFLGYVAATWFLAPMLSGPGGLVPGIDERTSEAVYLLVGGVFAALAGTARLAQRRAAASLEQLHHEVAERERSQAALSGSEERLRLAMQAASIGTWERDLGTNRIVLSDGLDRLFGLPEAAVHDHRQWYTRLHPEDGPRVARRLQDAIAGDDPYDVEYRIVRPDGEVRWIVSRGHVVRDGAGRPARMLGVAMDVTPRKRAEAERDAMTVRGAFLAEASTVLSSSLSYEQTLQTLARLSVPSIADWCSVDVVEEDGSVRRVAVTQADPRKAEIARAAAIYPPDPEGRHPRTRVLQTGRPILIPVVSDEWLARAAGSAEHLRALRALEYRSGMIVPLTARGRTLGALTFATAESGRTYGESDLALAEDLARRAAIALDNARLFEAEARAREQAEAANRSKDEFLTTVSHELRTPLQAMLGWVGALRQGKLTPEKSSRALDIIEQSGRAQARLIGDLLDVSRMVSGRLHLDLRPVDLATVLRTALDTVRPAAQAKAVRLEALLDARIGPVAGDPDRLTQVVWNLLSNAVKFTPAGGQVELRLEQGESEVRIVVRDTGEGITPAFLPHLFERFRQADEARSTTRRGGVGLGLAIVRHLVELHGGSVQAESPGVGRGAVFTVSLPLGWVEGESHAPEDAEDSSRRG
jgi:PAS domain S-box-containing protein